MFCGVGVHGSDTGIDVVDQHAGGLLARQRGGHPVTVHGGLQLVRQFPVGGVGQCAQPPGQQQGQRSGASPAAHCP